MVADGTSFRQIRRYLHRFVVWWQNTSGTWGYPELLQQFIEVCWQKETAAYAAGLCQLYFIKLHMIPDSGHVAA